MAIKVFSQCGEEEIEEKVNNFIKDIDGFFFAVTDIKFSTDFADYTGEVLCSAMIIYETKNALRQQDE
ncbi:sporulation protein Cse60 [Salinicoccus roseus]|uniref:sporulation protein Cse60 n=1 Tax=Salinicoccus roseus TaxID=45670 RepID=UPI00356246C0